MPLSRASGEAMRRREFITLLGGVAAIWPLAGHAQQPERVRRIGILVSLTQDNPEEQARLAAFAKALQELGWIDGRNIRIDYRWSGGDHDRTRKYAAELVALAPDVILAGDTSTVEPVNMRRRPSRLYSQVWLTPSRPVLSKVWRGRVATPPDLPNFEYGMSGKWVQLLKEIVPSVSRVGVLRNVNWFWNGRVAGSKPLPRPLQLK